MNKIFQGILYEAKEAEKNVKYADLLLSNKFKKFQREPFKGIKGLLKNNINIHTVFSAGFLEKDYDFQQIEGIGKKSSQRLQEFYSQLGEEIIDFSHAPHEEKIALYNKELIYKYYDVDLIGDEEILSGTSYYSLLAKLLREPILFSQRDTEIHNELLKIFKDKKYPDDNNKSINELIGLKYNLTSERVRQLGVAFFEKIPEHLEKINRLELDMELDVLIGGKDLIYCDDESLSRSNDKGVFLLNNNFIAYILSFYTPEYRLVGKLREYFLHQKFSNRHYWKYLYLVKRDIAESVDLTTIVQALFEKLNSRVTEGQRISVGDLAEQYKLTAELPPDLKQRIQDVLYQMLVNELSLKQVNGDVIIERNTNLLVWEHTYLALEALNKPSYLDEIVKKMEDMNPHRTFNSNSVRSSMITRDEFVHIGRQSKYGLKKWEEERPTFKGGTIRDIVEEYIHVNGMTHIDEITEHVLKYRPTTSKENIYSNLLLEKNKRFVIPKPGFIALGTGI